MTNIWDQYVNEAANRYGVPHALIQATLSQESGGKANAVSPKGAGGYMQIMPDTYAELAPKHGLGPNRFDPRDNILGGVAYMKQLYDKYGNWPEALQAYNAGMGTMEKVKAGKIPLPTETANYVPSVLRRAGMQGTDMARQHSDQTAFGRRVGAYDDDTELRQRLAEQERLGFPAASLAPGTFADATTPETEAKFGKLMGLLQVEPEKNFFEGLGGIWNAGQTPSQPPAPRGQVENLPSQTERLDVTGRMNELMQGLLAPQTRGPSLTPGQYQLAGAGEAVGQLAGVTNRRVGIGEILGALGGGLTRGTLLGEKAQQERLGNEFDRLGKFATIQGQQRTADLNERNSVFDNQYKQALTEKARLKDATDAKVVGKWIYENGQWKAPPGQADTGGPFEGNAENIQLYNQLIMLEQKQASGVPLSPQETYTLALIKRNLTAPKQTVSATGEVVEQTMPPLPVWGGQAPPGSPPGSPPTSAPPANAGPASPPRTVVTPSGATVTQVTPGGIPAGEQTELRKKIDTLNKLNGSVTTLGNNVEKTGLQIGGIGALGGTQSAMYEDLQTQLRLANELGVLNGPDERKLLEQISNPTKFMTYVRGLGGPEYFNAQMQVLKDKIAREIRQYEERLGVRKPDAGGTSASGGSGGGTRLKLDSQGNIVQ